MKLGSSSRIKISASNNKYSNYQHHRITQNYDKTLCGRDVVSTPVLVLPISNLIYAYNGTSMHLQSDYKYLYCYLKFSSGFCYMPKRPTRQHYFCCVLQNSCIVFLPVFRIMEVRIKFFFQSFMTQ